MIDTDLMLYNPNLGYYLTIEVSLVQKDVV